MRISDWSSDVCSSDLGSWPSSATRKLTKLTPYYSGEKRSTRGPGIHLRSACINEKEPGALRCGSLPGRGRVGQADHRRIPRSEEHTSELQSLMRISYAVFCLKHKKFKFMTLTSSMHVHIITTITTVFRQRQ